METRYLMDRLAPRQSNTPRLDGEQERPRQRYSISGRLRWSYLISSTLPLLLVGGLLILLNFQTQQRSVYTSQEMLTTQIAHDISGYIQGIESQLLSLGSGIEASSPPEQTAAAIQRLLSSNPDIRQITLISADGSNLLRFPVGQTTLIPRYANPLDDPLVQSALRAGQGGRSPIYRTADDQLLFTVVLPIRSRMGTIDTVISAELSAARISQLLRSANSGFERVSYVVDNTGEVMLNDGTRGWRPPPSLSQLFNGDTRIVQYPAGNGEMVVGARAVISPSNWWVVTEQSASAAFANVRRSVLILGMLVALVGLLALGWALLQAQQLLRPLQALREGAMALGAGHIDHRIDVDGAEEMKQLARSFNQMAERLQVSLSEIEQQNDRLRSGLMLARDIQMGLLPTQPPWNFDTLTVYARSIPAFEVGGDFYTYIALSGGQAAIAVGDISGKGVGAALLMALTSSMVESQARQIDQPSEMLGALNRLLTPRLKSNHMNAALLFATFDHQARTMTVANAGMISPLLVRPAQQAQSVNAPTAVVSSNTCTSSTQTQFVEVGGLPIGSLANAFYTDVVVALEPGDVVLFVSDGVVEAHNAAGELFGFERLEALIAGADDVDVHALVDLILHQVQEFIGPADQHDDITIVAVRPPLRPRSIPDDARPTVDTTLPVSTAR